MKAIQTNPFSRSPPPLVLQIEFVVKKNVVVFLCERCAFQLNLAFDALSS
jgi:hypothetical protein